MQHRSWLILATTFFWTPSLAAQELTLSDVMNALSSDSVRVEARTKAIQADRLDADAQGRWDAPTVQSELAHVADESEWSATVAQSFELSGNRGRLRHSAKARALSNEATSKAVLIEVQAQAATTFFEAVHIKGKIALIEERSAKMKEAEASIRRRVEAGDASVFELEWIQRELRNTALSLASTNAEMMQTMGELAAIAPIAQDSGVDGDLTTQCSAQEQPSPQAIAFQRQIDAEKIEIDLARSAWIPSVEVEAGWKAKSAATTEHGFVVGLGLTLPLWSAPSLAIDAAEARIAATQAELSLFERARTQELNATKRACESWLKIADKNAAAVVMTQKLSDRAAAGYAAGELSLLEWLSAEEGVLDDQMATLESKSQAKRLEIHIRQLSGGW